jgi:sugar phosphate isomerase/epimerase
MTGGLALANSSLSKDKNNLFKISLAEWSLHRALQSGHIDHLDFCEISKNEFGIMAVEYVNSFFFEKAKDVLYLKEMKLRAEDLDVKSLLIMCDNLGMLGDPDKSARISAVENHYKWVEAARFLGCHSIRVNASSNGSYSEQISLAADGLRLLAEFGETFGINIIVENHGGFSSNGEWLASVMMKVDHPRIGTLPDFGNFKIKDEDWYDRYKGVKELMLYAKAVSAKSHEFDALGNEINTDYHKMMKIVIDAGYSGYVGIEYEGNILDEVNGIHATKTLLEKVRDSL